MFERPVYVLSAHVQHDVHFAAILDAPVCFSIRPSWLKLVKFNLPIAIFGFFKKILQSYDALID